MICTLLVIIGSELDDVQRLYTTSRCTQIGTRSTRLSSACSAVYIIQCMFYSGRHCQNRRTGSSEHSSNLLVRIANFATSQKISDHKECDQVELNNDFSNLLGLIRGLLESRLTCFRPDSPYLPFSSCSASH